MAGIFCRNKHSLDMLSLTFIKKKKKGEKDTEEQEDLLARWRTRSCMPN